MSQVKLKIPFAERGGRLIHVSGVPRGLECDCVCPVCKDPVVARKGEVVQHHFAHYPGSECTPETVLHQVGKRLLFQRIAAHLEKGRPLPIRWKCTFCGEEHAGNLLKVARRVEMERTLEGCRPDLVLFDVEDGPVAIVEVVVTHSPDENVVNYCEQQGVRLVQFRLHRGRDLLALQHEKPLRPQYVDLCFKPQCEACGHLLAAARMYALQVTCWRCGFEMKAAVVRAGGKLAGPEVFAEKQVAMAEELGVLLRRNYSTSSAKSYLANTCPTCGAFIGAPYLRYHSGKTRGKTGHDAGSLCVHCAEESVPDRARAGGGK